MAVRLTVVISQLPRGSSKQQDLEACLIAELIGRAGLDVSLIGPLAEVEHSATDRLVLEGLTGDFALVAWQSPEDSMAQLQELEIDGRRAAHGADPQGASERGRRIYCFDWHRFDSAEPLVAALDQLLQERRVVTVSLAPPSSAGATLDRDGAALPGTNRHENSRDKKSPPSAAKPVGGSSSDQPQPQDASIQDAGVSERERAADARLDALVDDLNRLDL